ncbi:hypothetical protein SARC_00888 [Sphaeroforma arctica JP610]|uniref:Uncharacterized protein n=1 Tax=Sphaeroforma arctica JP610 TaxID=667725 RepID=A0A0L0GDB0_9EUKA|nr:hypothetical protein SARC_00888 [Sphaeroforma arctica JP610]KNC86995.1 hypothetical protein SARC_00888 [Sphaeroforma arctica JP610]|eukprot:XP_014160897.1 hypothetical protein SARC_00888 [Sphaeroforma arctica JP610]
MSDQHQGSAPPGNDNANTNTPYPPYPNVASPSSTYSGTGTDNTPTSGQPRSNTAPYPSYPSADSSHSSAYPSQPNANAPTTPYPTGAGGSLAATYSQSSTEQHQPAQALPQTYSTVFGASSVAPYPGGPTSQHRPEEMPASYSLAQGLSSAPYPGSGDEYKSRDLVTGMLEDIAYMMLLLSLFGNDQYTQSQGVSVRIDVL